MFGPPLAVDRRRSEDKSCLRSFLAGRVERPQSNQTLRDRAVEGYVAKSNAIGGKNMRDHDHAKPMTRREAARYSLKVVLAAGASVFGLALTTGPAHAGYGECSIYGCNCKNFMGSEQTCSNCGHSFQAHW
jgi:hypothetical protein